MASLRAQSCGTQSRTGSLRARRTNVTLAAVSTEGQVVLDKPAWTGDSWQSKVANFLIDTPAIFNVIKGLARQEIKSTATKRGVPWDENVRGLEAQLPELERIKREMERPELKPYPGYYTVPFHAYDEGNLNWQAAFECEPASYIMAIRTFKDQPQLTPEEALTKLRHGITDRYKEYLDEHSLHQPQRIVDIGCSVGVSTRWLEHVFPGADITGLDLSPYFLAVAEQVERRKAAGQKRIFYRHALAENTELPNASVDLVSLQFVIHECPGPVIADFIKEAARIVKPGGCLMICDNNPKSKTIQGLPPAIATLMKSTEPHSDSYYAYDVEAAMTAAGFKSVVTREADHRHRAVLGYL